MKLLITGGSGFIGSGLVRKALKLGYSVVNVDMHTYAASDSTSIDNRLSTKYVSEKIDIRNYEAVRKVFEKHRPQRVLHLAAETHVDRSIAAPEVFLETNIHGTFNMLEAAVNYWKSNGKFEDFRFLHVSTDEVFGSLAIDAEKFNEASRYDPRSPYAASKASSDHLVRAWNQTFGLPTLITNCSNNYGPFQYPEKLIPVIIISCLLGETIPIYGSGQNIRDWIHVDDHVDALILIMEKGLIGSSYNIGSDQEITNLELAIKICEIMQGLHKESDNRYVELINLVKDRPGHDFRYAIDSSKLKSELNWQPRTDFTIGLTNTVEWYLDHQDWWKSLKDFKIFNSNKC